MIWDEYVEDVTEHIRDRGVARALRRELKDHLDLLSTDLMTQGMDEEQARYEAMARLGPAQTLSLSFASRFSTSLPEAWPALVPLIGILLAILFGAFSVGAGGAVAWVVLWSLGWALLHARSFRTLVERPPHFDVVRQVKELPKTLAVCLLPGLLTALVYVILGSLYVGFGTVMVCVFVVAILTWVGVEHWLRSEGLEAFVYPLGAGAAALGFILCIVAVLVGTNLWHVGSYLLYATPGATGSHLTPVFPLSGYSMDPLALVTIYFTGVATLVSLIEWVRRRSSLGELERSVLGD